MSNPRVLVADDNPVSLRFLSDAIAACGAQCCGAVDGPLALQLANCEPFDLLVLDARMPGFGGIEVLARIRSRAGPNQQVIALATTADDAVSTRLSLLDAGFLEVLVKPIHLGALREVLTKYVALFAPAPGASECWFNDDQALDAAGGDREIVAALRRLFTLELEALPAQLSELGERRDIPALHDRLHRLAASAGFCGASAICRAVDDLQRALDRPDWPACGIPAFLDICACSLSRLQEGIRNHSVGADPDGESLPRK